MGVKHIQFDYARYYAKEGLDTHGMKRTEVITAFFRQAKHVLKEYNKDIEISADVYASAAFNDGKSIANIGQDLKAIAGYVDKIYLMAYPSHFYLINNENPGDHPEEVIKRTCEAIHKLLKYCPTTEVGIYVQGFRLKNYEREYGCEYVRDQLLQAYKCGIRSMLVWMPEYNSAAFDGVKAFNEDLSVPFNDPQPPKVTPISSLYTPTSPGKVSRRPPEK